VKANLRAFILITVFAFACLFSNAQTLSAFKVGTKWGFKKGEAVVIEPQYDSVFGFDQTNQICLVGNEDAAKRSINSLTKQVRREYTFIYINTKNQKLYFKAPMALDSSCVVTVNKQTGSLYLNNSQIFVAAINGKKILTTKKGVQISSGSYDNINFTKVPGFYAFEISSLWGLMDETAKQIIAPTYSKISFNVYDSVIYCCTAGSKFNGNDDIYNYKGEKTHTSSKHIQCAGKNYAVYRLFESENEFVIFDLKEKKEKHVKAEYIYYLKNDTVALLDDDWFLYDLKTDKRTPLDKKIIKYLKLDE
jgi:hypothetical protein